MLTIATICARGGSQGVPGKNIRPLLGKPLIAYTIQHALDHPLIDRVFVSTDSADIAEVALAAGAEVPFLRPSTLAANSSPKHPVVEHLVDWVVTNVGQVERIVDLDPTSPLRDVSDITSCLDLLDENTDVVFTCYMADKNPYFNMVELRADDEYVQLVKSLPVGVTSRQEAPKVFSMNASIYCWHYRSLGLGLWNGNARVHVMPRDRSIDIDEEIDFKIVEMLMRKKAKIS